MYKMTDISQRYLDFYVSGNRFKKFLVKILANWHAKKYFHNEYTIWQGDVYWAKEKINKICHRWSWRD